MSWWTKKKRVKSDNTPEWWQTYLTKFDHSYSKKTPIEAIRFVVFDTETSGLDPRKDALLSIGAVKVQQNQLVVSDTFECFVEQQYQPTGNSIAIHGILPQGKEQKIPEEQAVRQFVEYCGDAVLVGHHVAFDRRMMNTALAKHGSFKLKNFYVDTSKLAARVQPAMVRRPGELGLDHLCSVYGIATKGRHTAVGDAFITAVLFMKLLARLRRRGIQSLGDLMR